MTAAMRGWWPVAPAAEIGAAPRRVEAAGRAYVAFRPVPGAAVSVLTARCPHRLVRLDHGVLAGGRLRCAYHGWEFEPDGECAAIPSAEPGAAPPPRARLERPWGVREEGGLLWVAPVDPAGDPDGGIGRPDEARGTEQIFTNLDPSLQSGWHPVALRSELAGGPVDVRLLGRNWTLRLDPAGRPAAMPANRSSAEGPAGHAVNDRYGLVWLAPQPPRVPILAAPDDAAPGFVGAWLVPDRSTSCAGLLADNFLDVAHFPFVHAGTFGAAEEPYVPPFDVRPDGDGFSSVQEQWFDNPQDPGVAAGLRPVRQRRRATYSYAPPFQLALRLEELDAGAVKTILFFLQPEDLRSTRIYTKMLLHNIGGVGPPDPEVVAAEVAFEVAVLAEDLALQQAMTVTGLPLRMRDELHVRADRSGVALRRALTSYQKGCL